MMSTIRPHPVTGASHGTEYLDKRLWVHRQDAQNAPGGLVVLGRRITLPAGFVQYLHEHVE